MVGPMRARQRRRSTITFGSERWRGPPCPGSFTDPQAGKVQAEPMLAGLAFATILPLVQAAAVAAETPPPPPPPPEATAAGPQPDDSCEDAEREGADTRTIVVCAQRPQGYRLNPDVMAAKKAKKRHGRGGAPGQPENFKQNDCATVGPMGCRGEVAIDVVSAALVAAQMAAKAAKGEDVGKMFVTDPHPSEYQLYLMAKAEREAREAEEAAEKVRAAARSGSPRKPASVADPLPEQ